MAFVLSSAFPAMASAQADVAGSVMNGIAAIMSYIVAGLNLLTWVFFFYANVLLDPNFIFGLDGGRDGATGLTSMERMLNTIWILSRDIMNIVFALLLIAAAVWTVVRANKDLVKQHLVPFIAAVILVNFSWFLPRVVIDIANVAAAAVYDIPSMIADDTTCRYKTTSPPDAGARCSAIGGDTFECPCQIVTDVQFFVEAEGEEDPVESMEADGYSCPLGFVLCIKKEELNYETVAGHSAILNGLIINHGRLQTLATVPKTSGEGGSVGKIIMFMLVQILVILIHVAILFPLAALVLAFAIRIPVLWLTIAFMPFVALQYVAPIDIAKEYAKKILDNFLKAAFLPAAVGIPLAIGFILVNAGSNVSGGSLEDIGIKLTDDISNFWQLLWLVIAVGVLWVGVFQVMDKMGIMAAGSKAIKSTGESLGRLAVKAPLSAKVIPGVGGGKFSPLQMLKSFRPQNIEYKLDSGMDFNEAVSGAFRGNFQGSEIASAARTRTTDASVRQLNTSLKNLTDQLKRNPGMSSQDLNRNIDTTINQPHFGGVSGVNDANLVEHLQQDFLNHLPNTIAQREKDSLRDSIGDLRQALAARAGSTPPASTPPPAGPAPTPPPATP